EVGCEEGGKAQVGCNTTQGGRERQGGGGGVATGGVRGANGTTSAVCAGGWTDRDRTNVYDGCVVDRDANHDTNHGHGHGAVYVEAVELGKVESRVGGVSGEAGVMWGDG
ncbi:hypothetical protein ScalyP_jg3401, partial [Parmales sp. scaly parma]